MKRFVNIKSLVTIVMIALFSVSVVAMAPDNKKKKKKKKNSATTTEVRSQRKTLYDEMLEAEATRTPGSTGRIEAEATRNTSSTGRQTSNRTTGANVKEDYGKTVTLVTSGTGATEDKATRVALRSAIEQAFGTFVSASTTVVNDELVNDAIATVSSGSVLSYDPISCISQPDAGYQVTIKAVVSINNLVTFATNRGMTAELSGNTFLHNRKLAELNKKNEKEAILNLVEQCMGIKGIYDYEIEVGNPKPVNGEYEIKVDITLLPNANYELYGKTVANTLRSLSLSDSERQNYKRLDLPFYTLCVEIGESKTSGGYVFPEYIIAENTNRGERYFLRSYNTPHYGGPFALLDLDRRWKKLEFEVYDNLGTVIAPFITDKPDD